MHQVAPIDTLLHPLCASLLRLRGTSSRIYLLLPLVTDLCIEEKVLHSATSELRCVQTCRSRTTSATLGLCSHSLDKLRTCLQWLGLLGLVLILLMLLVHLISEDTWWCLRIIVLMGETSHYIILRWLLWDRQMLSVISRDVPIKVGLSWNGGQLWSP